MISALIKQSSQKLISIAENPRLEAELLLAHVLNVTRTYLYTHTEQLLTQNQQMMFESLLNRRLKGEPFAYIVGKKAFWSFELDVTPSTLIPRPETELLVELTLQQLSSRSSFCLNSPSLAMDPDQSLAGMTEWDGRDDGIVCNDKGDPEQDLWVADLGTGSGAIALALALEQPSWKIVATDISEEALKVAQANARRLNCSNLFFYQGDWCAALPRRKFAAIISNPPYIALDDKEIEPFVVQFEPNNALFSGLDGLESILKIITSAGPYLSDHGWLLLEHGASMAGSVVALLEQNHYTQISTYPDLSGKLRVTMGRKA